MQNRCSLFLQLTTIGWLTLGSVLLHAQPQETPRPKERTVLLEKMFIEASREKMLGNTEEAIQLYWEVLQKDDTNAASHYELARLYQLQKNLSKALIHAARAVELEGDNIVYNDLYARLLEKEGDYRKAADLYAKLTNTYPDREGLYTDWAYYLTKAGRPDAAIKVYNTLEKRVGIQETTSMRKYKLYTTLGKTKKAVQELEQLVEAYPKEPEYFIRLANYYSTTQNFVQAKAYYQKALDLNPDHPTANMAMVEFFLQNGDTARYLNALMTTFENPSQEILVKVTTLQSLVDKLQKGQLSRNYQENIYALSERLTQVHPNNSAVHALRGDVLFQEERYRAASNQYEMAIRSVRNDLSLWRRLLESLERAQQDTRLQSYAKTFSEYYPDQAYSFYYMGVALYQTQSYDQAIKELQQAMDIGFNNMALQGNALRYLARVHEAKEDWTKVEKYYNEAILMQPDDEEIIHDYARSLISRKVELEKAAELLQGIRDKHPNNLRFTNTAAWLAYQKTNYDQAKQLVQSVLDANPNNAEALERYGDVLFRTGQEDEALQYWQKAFNKGSNAPLLPKKIATKQLYE